MLTIAGTFENGVARPLRAIEGREGQPVLITFLPEGESAASDSAQVDGDDILGALIDSCKSHTGIPDLAAEHDHYAHGKPRAHESSS